MRTRHLWIVAAWAVTAAAAFAMVMREDDDRPPHCWTMRTRSGHSVVVQVASTAAARARGLSERDGPTAGGLLLKWPDSPGGPCPLLEPAVPRPTRAVLELPAGPAAALGVTPGVYLAPIGRLFYGCASPASPHAPTVSGL